ncbi:hypothetical protein AGDE_13859 [Angomonas deanei]|uniref:Uncharacterized protein n=1 Tax=Angomonas deanei TaxID=59799 RepID=A0A7G2CHN5_9TRYP|nr:hypothetical protein AGDE_13859 [Angomonas deanei]CAD2219266.1 hypothetical protein, conserved [Angomonas deanei]|eukprot:EPY21687.1 hypothetical protein AGDE_13859 [Angomonas deanei]
MRELERKMKSSVPTLPRKCRLARQKRFDISWQNSLDKQRLLAAESSFTIQTSAEASKTLNVNSNVNYNNSMALEHISSANASFANLSLARSTSRQLEYDITPWARQSSTYRKGMSTSQEFVNSPSALPPTAPTSGHMDQAQKKLALQVSEELPPLPDNISVSSRQSRGGATPLRRPVYERFDSARPSPQHSCVNRAENSVGSHGRASGSLPSSALATPKEADYDEDIELDSSGSSVSDTEAGPYVDETKEEIPETETADNGNYNLFSEKSVDEQNEIAVKSFLEPRLMSNSIIASSNGDEEPGSPPLPAGGGVDLQHIVSFDGEAAFGEDKDKELVNKDGELSSLGGDESDEASEAPEEQEEGEEGKDVAETS